MASRDNMSIGWCKSRHYEDNRHIWRLTFTLKNRLILNCFGTYCLLCTRIDTVKEEFRSAQNNVLSPIADIIYIGFATAISALLTSPDLWMPDFLLSFWDASFRTTDSHVVSKRPLPISDQTNWRCFGSAMHAFKVAENVAQVSITACLALRTCLPHISFLLYSPTLTILFGTFQTDFTLQLNSSILQRQTWFCSSRSPIMHTSLEHFCALCSPDRRAKSRSYPQDVESRLTAPPYSCRLILVYLGADQTLKRLNVLQTFLFDHDHWSFFARVAEIALS